ncbi:SWIM zinc finger family protein [Sphaerisporangium perillae]|uniref:SWIM zinc finger family protein n=1 Tax=Sphaerisporangium perillae TaxID=2935860 RepID=UPI00201066FC|nr:SWIM zinc finger family protein [Sphaerisporangium perillae]
MSTPAKWSAMGVMPEVLWGECKGSGTKPYLACVDLGDPAYRCSCPSRKFPCKHALGLLLLWSADSVPSAESSPAWVAEWLQQRRARAVKAAATSDGASPDGAPSDHDASDGGAPDRAASDGDVSDSGASDRAASDDGDVSDGDVSYADASPPGPGRTDRSRVGTGDGAAADRRAAQREQRVAAGLSELERWLADQIGQGLATARQNAPAQWEELTRRLVDAQAPGVAGVVGRLPRVLTEEDWPARLLGEYGLLHLLAVGHRRAPELPAPLRDTIRSRVGFPTPREEVLAGATQRDHWVVLGGRDEEQDRLVSRRVWLWGRRSGRPALVLSFAPAGQALDASLVVGTTIDADLAFYPGASPLRALVAVRHEVMPPGAPAGSGVRVALREVAAALEGDPWLESWPVVLGPVVPARQADRWLLADADVHVSADADATPNADPDHDPAHARDADVDAEPDATSHADPAQDPAHDHDAGAGSALDAADDATPDADDHTAPAPALHADDATLRADPAPARDADVDAAVSAGAPGGIDGMPLHPSVGVPWRLLAVSGGHPLTVAAEWTPRGLRPLTTWDEEGQVVVL